MKIELPPCHVGHEGRLHFDVPLCLEKSLFDLRRFVLVLRDLPTSVQFFHDQINAVILHQRVVHDDLCCSPALAFELSQKPSTPAGSSPLSCHGFVPRRAPLPTVDLPSQNLVQNRQYRDTVTCLTAHTEQIFAKVAKVRIICTRSGSIVILLPPTHQQGSRNNQGHQMNQRCTIMTKLVLCSEPHACAQTAVRQMMIVR